MSIFLGDCMIHDGRRERVRERFLMDQGKSFADHEILELLLYYSIPQKDTNELAHKLLHHFNSLDEVLEANYHDLINVEGVGKNTAILLNLILPLYSAYSRSKYAKKIELKTFDELSKYCFSLLRHERNEVLYCIALNASYEILGQSIVSRGTNKELYIHVKQVVEVAIRFNAVNLVLCHNHPSGNCEPSVQDEEYTIKADKVLSVLGIKLLDHIIIADPYAYSMKEHEAHKIIT